MSKAKRRLKWAEKDLKRAQKRYDLARVEVEFEEGIATLSSLLQATNKELAKRLDEQQQRITVIVDNYVAEYERSLPKDKFVFVKDLL